jgi:disulfide bond formation protein DsbB
VQFLYKHAMWIAFLASASVLSTVFVAQYGFDLQPCVLCIYQRWPYAVILAFFVLWIAFKGRINQAYFKFFAGLSFAVTSGIGAFHVGVEKGWWKGTAECAADTSSKLTLDELRAQILTAPIVKCDEVAWEMLGISMAGYNFLFGATMAIFMVLALKTNNRGSRARFGG